MVSSGGMLHAPRSVARLIATAPGVESVRLRVVPDQRMGRRTVAEVTVAEDLDVSPTPDGLRALVRDRLGAASEIGRASCRERTSIPVVDGIRTRQRAARG